VLCSLPSIALLDRCDACEVIRAAEEAKRKRMLLLKQKLLKKKKVVMNKTIPFFVSFNDWYYQLLQNYHHHHHHPDTPLFFDWHKLDVPHEYYHQQDQKVKEAVLYAVNVLFSNTSNISFGWSPVLLLLHCTSPPSLFSFFVVAENRLHWWSIII